MFYTHEPAWATPDPATSPSSVRPRYAFQRPVTQPVDPRTADLAVAAAAGLALFGLAALLPDQTRLLLLSGGLIGTGSAGLLWHGAVALRTRRAARA